MRDALKIYRQTQREAVPEEAGMGVLMRALVDSVATARRAMAAGNLETSNKHLIACQTVLHSLSLGVNPEVGELAERLQALYGWCEAQLGEANISHEVTALDEVLAVLRNLRDAFEGVRTEEEEGVQ